MFSGLNGVGRCVVADSVTLDGQERTTDLVVVLSADSLSSSAADCANAP
ncbi:MAG: hypothetical protein AB7Q17_18030 [Phycisphaerae bacterium]